MAAILSRAKWVIEFHIQTCVVHQPPENSCGVVVLLLSGALESALAASGWSATQIVDTQDLGKSCDIIVRYILSHIKDFF